MLMALQQPCYQRIIILKYQNVGDIIQKYKINIEYNEPIEDEENYDELFDDITENISGTIQIKIHADQEMI